VKEVQAHDTRIISDCNAKTMGCEMSRLCKLKIRIPGAGEREELCDLKQAKYLIDFDDDETICLVQGQIARSYEEFLQLASNDLHSGKELLEVILQPIIAGG